MQFKVILNTETRYLCITTYDGELPENRAVLFMVSCTLTDDEFSVKNCYTMCKCYCLGVLQGNQFGGIKNSPNDFGGNIQYIVNEATY